jgi:hypothetical protein
MPGDTENQENVDPDDVALVREALARSLEGLNHFESRLRAARSPEVRALLSRFQGEERARMVAALRLLRTMEPTLGEAIEGLAVASAASTAPAGEEGPPTGVPAPEASETDASTLGAPVLTAPERTLRSGEAPPGAMTGRLTIGSLRRR